MHHCRTIIDLSYTAYMLLCYNLLAMLSVFRLDAHSKETTVINQIFGGFLRSQGGLYADYHVCLCAFVLSICYIIVSLLSFIEMLCSYYT